MPLLVSDRSSKVSTRHVSLATPRNFYFYANLKLFIAPGGTGTLFHPFGIMKGMAAAFVTRPSRRFPALLHESTVLSLNDVRVDVFDSHHSSSILADSSTSADVVADALSTQDIIVGSIIAVILAFGYSYLNGQSSSSNFVSWSSQTNKEDKLLAEVETTTTTTQTDDDNVFDANEWKDISREENYVLYNTKIKSSLQQQRQSNSPKLQRKTENKWVLVALLALFVPIFSVEFFFALSRQFLCEIGDPSDRIEVVQKLCSPVR